jgi:hypothetical protein
VVVLVPASGSENGGKLMGGSRLPPPPSSPLAGGVEVDESSPELPDDASSEPVESSDEGEQLLQPPDEPEEPEEPDDDVDPELPPDPPELEELNSEPGSVVPPLAQPASASAAPHANGARSEKTSALDRCRSTVRMLTDTSLTG